MSPYGYRNSPELVGQVRKLQAANRLISFGGDLAIIYTWSKKIPSRSNLRRVVLVSQVDSRRPDWEDINGREEIRRDLGGTVLADWLGDTDPSDRYEDDDYECIRNVKNQFSKYLRGYILNVDRRRLRLSESP